jgi:arylsulfatase A-like enzyme
LAYFLELRAPAEYEMTRAALVLLCGLVLSSSKKPNIVMIVSDDLGFNDVSFHGSPQVPTPHIDAIAAEGVTLMDYHVQPVCSPTRATIMSGRHVIHTGIYMPFQQGTALRLHLNYTLLPAYLKQLGYRTHMVGKWHLGQNVLAALPTGRGFDSYFGYWSGAEDYFTHDCRGAYDLADGVRTAFEFNNSYSTFLWTQKAVEVVEQSDAAEPFFLYLAYQNIHWPLEAPQSYIDRFANRTAGNAGRQSILAMVSVMDEGVGNLTAALKAKGIYDDTLLIFSTDNGGPTNGNEGTWSNNYPMRGGKNTIWEGGTRGVGAVRGAGIAPALVGTQSFGKMHVADWVPTLLHAASGDPDWFEQHIAADEPPHALGDGIDVWGMLATGATPSPRTEVLQECHPGGAHINHGNSLTVGDWKAIKIAKNDKHEAGWAPPPGQDPAAVTYTLKCDAAGPPPGKPDLKACSADYCLFNVATDPCEYHDVAKAHPDIVASIVARLADYQATAVGAVQPEGCVPVITDGAWRPCDSPDPNSTNPHATPDVVP